MSESTVPPHASLLQMIDWRLGQMQQGFAVHCAAIKSNMDERFYSLEDNISRFFSEISKLKQMVVQTNDEIKEMKEDKASMMDRLDELERKLESTEQNMKACNVKIMNVTEDEWEDEYVTTQIVVDLLNDHGQSPGWHQEDMVRAFRIGRPRPRTSDPRPILVQFCRWTDKMAVLGDRDLRDSLRRSGIRVASDLTTRQRDMVEFHRGQGKIAYIRNGKLHVRDRQQAAPSRHNSEWYFSPERRERVEDWPQLQATQRNRKSRDSEALQYSKHVAGKNYRYQYEDHLRRQKPNKIGDCTNMPEDRPHSGFNQHLNHQQRIPRDMYRRRGTVRNHSNSRCSQDSWNDSPKDWKNSQFQDSCRTGSIPIVPGSRSYSEVTKYHRPSQQNVISEHRRMVMIKGNSKGPNAARHLSSASASQKPAGINMQKSPARQATASSVADGVRDLAQCEEDKTLSPTGEADRYSDAETEHGESVICQTVDETVVTRQDNDGDGSILTDDETATDTDHMNDIELETRNTGAHDEILTENDEPQKPDKTYYIEQTIEQQDKDMTCVTGRQDNSDPENLTGPELTNDIPSDRQNSKFVAGGSGKAVHKGRQTRSSVRDLRPRRAASSTGASSQARVKSPQRSTSQSSIVDSFRKAQTCQPKPCDRPPSIKGSSGQKTNGAPHTNK